jgi:hypothetical protein
MNRYYHLSRHLEPRELTNVTFWSSIVWLWILRIGTNCHLRARCACLWSFSRWKPKRDKIPQHFQWFSILRSKALTERRNEPSCQVKDRPWSHMAQRLSIVFPKPLSSVPIKLTCPHDDLPLGKSQIDILLHNAESNHAMPPISYLIKVNSVWRDWPCHNVSFLAPWDRLSC